MTKLRKHIALILALAALGLASADSNNPNYLGCFIEKDRRAFDGITWDFGDASTIEECAKYCAEYPYYSIQNS